MENMNLERYELLVDTLSEYANELRNSKDFFWGGKTLKYISIIKQFRFFELVRSLIHDIKGLRKKSNLQINEFKKENRIVTNEKIIVYSSIYGDYDKILEPLMVENECEYIMFTDKRIPEGSIWKKGDETLIPHSCDTPVLRNRYVKMHPHKLFSNKYSIYIDGNIQIVGRVSYLMVNAINDSKTGIALHKHPRNNCIYQEAESTRYLGKITSKQYFEIIKYYKQGNMPHNYGMFECNVIARKHSRKECKEIMDFWWELLLHGIKRDQLYFTYVLYTMGYEYSDITNYGGSVGQNKIFIRKNHN